MMDGTQQESTFVLQKSLPRCSTQARGLFYQWHYLTKIISVLSHELIALVSLPGEGKDEPIERLTCIPAARSRWWMDESDQCLQQISANYSFIISILETLSMFDSDKERFQYFSLKKKKRKVSSSLLFSCSSRMCVQKSCHSWNLWIWLSEERQVCSGC